MPGIYNIFFVIESDLDYIMKSDLSLVLPWLVYRGAPMPRHISKEEAVRDLIIIRLNWAILQPLLHILYLPYVYNDLKINAGVGAKMFISLQPMPRTKNCDIPVSLYHQVNKNTTISTMGGSIMGRCVREKSGYISFPQNTHLTNPGSAHVDYVLVVHVLMSNTRCIFITTSFRLNRRSCLLSESGSASIPTFDLFSQQTVSTFCQSIF
jgi:hypothetical protein